MRPLEPYRALLEPMWRLAQVGQFEIVSSELVLLETLVKPLRERDYGSERNAGMISLANSSMERVPLAGSTPGICMPMTK